MKRDILKVIAAIIVAITCFIGGRVYQATEDSKQWNLDYKVAWKAEHCQNYWMREILHKVMMHDTIYWNNVIMNSNEYANWESSINEDFEDFYAEY